MFNSCEFTFRGESSRAYCLKIYDIEGHSQSDVSFGNVGSIVETRTNRRIQPIHFGVNYTSKPLQFTLVFGADNPLSRTEMERIAFWLTGYQDYQWLSIDQPDLSHVQYRCLIRELTPISVGWIPYAFEAQVICDCPYAYGMPFRKTYQITGSKDVVIINEGTAHEPMRPLMTFEASAGTTSLKIVNASDHDREFLLENMPGSGVNVTVDNVNGIIVDSKMEYNLYPGFNLNFFRLVPGSNRLHIEGSGKLVVSGRFLHNVTA